MNKFFTAVQGVFKAAVLRFGASRWSWTAFSLGGTTYDYGRSVGQARGNAAVMATVRWVCRTFPEAPLLVYLRRRDGTLDEQADHALAALLERPNPYYSGLQLWTGTLADLMLSGNAYWLKVRSQDRRVVELWWLPAAAVEPRWPDDGRPPFITHYDYTVDGQVDEYAPQDICHFRDGFDPANVRKGLSPLAALFREIATDDEAANFTATLLRNLGVPGVVISPQEAIQATDADLEDVKVKFMQRFGGDRRGEPLVLRGPTDVKVLSFSPEQMQTREARRIPEERITAIYGIGAIVVGLGAGLDRSTFANMSEAREAAYEGMLIPLQRMLLADLQHQLAADFGDARTLRLGFDYSQVRVLQDDQNALMTRAAEGYQKGILTRGEARELVGQPVENEDDVFVIAATMSLMQRDQAPEEPVEAVVDGGDESDGEPFALPVAAGRHIAVTKVQGDPAEITDADLTAWRARARAIADTAPLLPSLLDAEPVNGNGAHA